MAMSNSPWTKPRERTSVTLCLKKVRYHMETAQKIAARMTERNLARGDVPCKAYFCPYCAGWHVTRGAGKKYTT